MKQTAVEWLIDESMKLVVQYMKGTLNEDTLDDVIYELGTKAKEMEKEQIINAWDKRGDRIVPKYFLKENITGEQYYNQTYNSKQ
jgi:hypothetical protein